jgi:hypothetical protein
MAEQDQGRVGQRLATGRTVSEPLRVGRARVRQLLDFVEEFLAATGEHA